MSIKQTSGFHGMNIIVKDISDFRWEVMNKFYYFHNTFYYHSMANNGIWDDTDQSLAVLMQQGNHQAFGKLYDKYAPTLMGLI